MGVCQVISCILHNSNLTEVQFDHEPPACIVSDSWQLEGLAVPSEEVSQMGWTAVLEFLRAGVYPLAALPAAVGMMSLSLSPPSSPARMAEFKLVRRRSFRT